MLPTFDAPRQHLETIGARRQRKSREERDSISTCSSDCTQSNGNANLAQCPSSTTPSSLTSNGKEKKLSRVFALFRGRNKEVEEIAQFFIEEAPGTRQEAGAIPPPQLEEEDDPSRSLSTPEGPRAPTSKPLPAIPNSNDVPLSKGVVLGQMKAADRQASSSSTDFTNSLGAQFERTAITSQSTFLTLYDDILSEVLDGKRDEVLASQATVLQLDRSILQLPPLHDSGNRHLQDVLLEPVEETWSRAYGVVTSAASPTTEGAAQPPFARTLAKMDNAGTRIISARLNEKWNGLDTDNDSYQEVLFEKRLWALTAYQKLTKGKHLQSPIHDILIPNRQADRRRILNLHGSLADGWALAARYPSATVYTLSSRSAHDPSSTYPPPLNHHNLYVASVTSPSPFSDSYFDAVFSRSIPVLLRIGEWATVFQDCMRVLKPRGHMEILSLDPQMTKQGSALMKWVNDHTVMRLEAHGMHVLPSEAVLREMDAAGLQGIRRARIGLPTTLPRAKATTSEPRERADTDRMMGLLGRHLYQDLYGTILQLKREESFFWDQKEIRLECERLQTKMILVIACGQKPALPVNLEGFLDV